MLGQRRRRCPSIKPALEQYLVFAGNTVQCQSWHSKHETFTQRRLNVGPPSATLANIDPALVQRLVFCTGRHLKQQMTLKKQHSLLLITLYV